MSKLPDKPSTLIRLALDDLKKCEASDDYVIDMADWHVPFGSGRCEVCLAGAVMAQSLGVGISRDTTPGSMGEGLDRKLSSLEEFRQGYIHSGLRKMGIEPPEDLYDEDVPMYEDDRDGFRSAMQNMANILEEEGL